MLYNNNSKTSYIDYGGISEIPMKIIEQLLTDKSEIAENLWKILKYPSLNALKNNNLTYEEKRDLIWNPTDENQSLENQYNVFTKKLSISSLNTDKGHTQLRIFQNIVKPLVSSTIFAYNFEIVTYEGISSHVYNKSENGTLVPRVTLIEEYLLLLLNGRDIGYGVMEFMPFNGMSGINIISDINNSKSMIGDTMSMRLLYTKHDIGGECSG